MKTIVQLTMAQIRDGPPRGVTKVYLWRQYLGKDPLGSQFFSGM